MSKMPLNHASRPPQPLGGDADNAVVDLSCGSNPFANNHYASALADDPVAPTANRPRHLQDALERVREKRHPEEKVHRVELDLKKIADCLSAARSRHGRPAQMTLSDTPCNPLELRPLLATIKWAKFWTTKHRWYAIRSSLNWILRETGWVDERGLAPIELGGVWGAAKATIAPKSRQYIFTKFAQFVIRRGGSPADVTEEMFEEYRQLRLTRTIDISAESGLRALRCIWNGLVGRLTGWLGRQLQAPRSPRAYSVSRRNAPSGLHPGLQCLSVATGASGPARRCRKAPFAGDDQVPPGSVPAVGIHLGKPRPTCQHNHFDAGPAGARSR